MKFIETCLQGAYLVDLEKREDARGFFSRLFCQKEFVGKRLMKGIVQINDSYSRSAGTLRGMHYQLPPHGEIKLLRCIRGRIFDVIIDLRMESPTYCRWFGHELSGENRTMMYVPERFAHGFLTLVDDCEVIYMASQFYAPDAERGIRWNDPKFKIQWPFEPRVISDKDRQIPDFVQGVRS